MYNAITFFDTVSGVIQINFALIAQAIRNSVDMKISSLSLRTGGKQLLQIAGIIMFYQRLRDLWTQVLFNIVQKIAVSGLFDNAFRNQIIQKFFLSKKVTTVLFGISCLQGELKVWLQRPKYSEHTRDSRGSWTRGNETSITLVVERAVFKLRFQHHVLVPTNSCRLITVKLQPGYDVADAISQHNKSRTSAQTTVYHTSHQPLR